jgi:YspA, cpYpsA-related SLOG family
VAEPRRRLLVTGSRDWNDAATIWRILKVVWAFDPDTLLVSGACPRGADLLCETYWDEYLGGGTERHPANWYPGGAYDRSAGFRRNEEMVHLGAWGCAAFILPCEKQDCRGRAPDRGLSYHGTHGSVHCADYAEDHGIETRRFVPILAA